MKNREMYEEAESLINTLETEHKLSKEDLVKLLTLNDAGPVFEAADRVRERFVGNDVHLRGLIEFSSHCGRTCLYCGLRAPNKNIKRYRMESYEIAECALNASKYGLKTVVLQSGEDRTFRIDELCKIISEIKKMDLAVTLSIGEMSKNEYAELKKAGADRYLLRIETSNEVLYKKLHPRMSYKNRIRCLYDIKDLGFEVGTGSLIGLPGQTPEILADDLLFFKELDADMIGLGPFIPCINTPLEDKSGGSVDTVLRMLALARLLMPDINIPATTALGIKDSNGYQKGLLCGANVIMPNAGMCKYKKLYAIYPGKDDGTTSSDLEEQIKVIKAIVFNLGRSIGTDFGYRKKSRTI